MLQAPSCVQSPSSPLGPLAFRLHDPAFSSSSPQCKKFRDQLSPGQEQMLREKLCASELFKGKKASYPQR